MSNPIQVKDITLANINNTNFGENIQGMVTNIDDNFKALYESGIYNGSAGLTPQISKVSLFYQDDDGVYYLSDTGRKLFNTIFGGIISDASDDNIFNSIESSTWSWETIKDILDNTLYDKYIGPINGVNVYDSFMGNDGNPDVENATWSMWTISSYDNPEATPEPVAPCFPYVFTDARIVQLTSENAFILDSEDEFVDQSCIVFGDISTEENSDGDIVLSKSYAYPTLYWDSSYVSTDSSTSGAWCWKINGNYTGVAAEGIPGKPSNSYIHILSKYNTDSVGNGYMYYYSGSWWEKDEYTETIGFTITDGAVGWVLDRVVDDTIPDGISTLTLSKYDESSSTWKDVTYPDSNENMVYSFNDAFYNYLMKPLASIWSNYGDDRAAAVTNQEDTDYQLSFYTKYKDSDDNISVTSNRHRISNLSYKGGFDGLEIAGDYTHELNIKAPQETTDASSGNRILVFDEFDAIYVRKNKDSVTLNRIDLLSNTYDNVASGVDTSESGYDSESFGDLIYSNGSAGDEYLNIYTIVGGNEDSPVNFNGSIDVGENQQNYKIYSNNTKDIYIKTSGGVGLVNKYLSFEGINFVVSQDGGTNGCLMNINELKNCNITFNTPADVSYIQAQRVENVTVTIKTSNDDDAVCPIFKNCKYITNSTVIYEYEGIPEVTQCFGALNYQKHVFDACYEPNGFMTYAKFMNGDTCNNIYIKEKESDDLYLAYLFGVTFRGFNTNGYTTVPGNGYINIFDTSITGEVVLSSTISDDSVYYYNVYNTPLYMSELFDEYKTYIHEIDFPHNIYVKTDDSSGESLFNYNGMFKDYTILSKVNNLILNYPNDTTSMFENCIELNNVNIRWSGEDSDIDYTFYNNSSSDDMFKNCLQLSKISAPKHAFDNRDIFRNSQLMVVQDGKFYGNGWYSDEYTVPTQCFENFSVQDGTPLNSENNIFYIKTQDDGKVYFTDGKDGVFSRCDLIGNIYTNIQYTLSTGEILIPFTYSTGMSIVSTNLFAKEEITTSTNITEISYTGNIFDLLYNTEGGMSSEETNFGTDFKVDIYSFNYIFHGHNNINKVILFPTLPNSTSYCNCSNAFENCYIISKSNIPYYMSDPYQNLESCDITTDLVVDEFKKGDYYISTDTKIYATDVYTTLNEKEISQAEFNEIVNSATLLYEFAE